MQNSTVIQQIKYTQKLNCSRRKFKRLALVPGVIWNFGRSSSVHFDERSSGLIRSTRAYPTAFLMYVFKRFAVIKDNGEGGRIIRPLTCRSPLRTPLTVLSYETGGIVVRECQAAVCARHAKLS